MAGINTCWLHMLKAKHEDKHFDLMQLLWNSDVWKKFRKVRNNTALCLQRLTRWGGWRPGTPWRCGGTGSTPSFAHLHQLEGTRKRGCLQAVPSKKIGFLFPHFCRRESLKHFLKIPPVQQWGSESIWLLAALVAKCNSVSKPFLNLRERLWT